MAIIVAATIASGAAYATNLHKDCIPTQYKDSGGNLKPINAPYHCVSPVAVCTYDADGAPCETNGTFRFD